MMMKQWLGCVFLVVVFALNSSAAEHKDCSAEENYPQISKIELKQLVRDKKVFVVDVNSEESFKKNHVDTAIHYGAHEKEFLSVLPKDKAALIIAYCGGTLCTAWLKAARRACEAGYTNVRHFKGGIHGWVNDTYVDFSQAGVKPQSAKSDSFLSSSEARSLIEKKGAILIDVRSQDEYREKHIPGALLFPIESLESNLFRLGDFDRPIVVYCRSGKRAGMAKDLLEKAGFKQVYNLGGVDRWESK